MSITKEQTITLLEDIVSQYGEDHTATCTYWDHGNRQPLCIAGVAFVKLGADEDEMAYIQGTIGPLGENVYEAGYMGKIKGRRANEWVREELRKAVDLDFDKDALDVLAEAQFEQDSGKTWGEALEAAKAVAA